MTTEITRATAREATDLVVEYRDEHVVTIAYTTPGGERTVLEVMSYGEPLAIYRSTEHEADEVGPLHSCPDCGTTPCPACDPNGDQP